MTRNAASAVGDRNGNLIARAKQLGLFVSVDRATPWGNPLVLGRDGDSATVTCPSRPSLLGTA